MATDHHHRNKCRRSSPIIRPSLADHASVGFYCRCVSAKIRPWHRWAQFAQPELSKTAFWISCTVSGRACQEDHGTMGHWDRHNDQSDWSTDSGKWSTPAIVGGVAETTSQHHTMTSGSGDQARAFHQSAVTLDWVIWTRTWLLYCLFACVWVCVFCFVSRGQVKINNRNLD